MKLVHVTKRGFTLIELAIAVLIIGILAAVMLPMYQRTVLKSRYAAMMPIAKTMANNNESYYLEHGIYADNAQDLPVQGRQNYPDGTELEFGTSSNYAYVLASNPSVKHNTYVVYQKHSKNFADDTHCEAFTADEQANHVCQSFGGTPLDGSLSGEDYTAYLLSGNGNGTFEKECKGSFTTEKECPSGCGVMTRDSAGCNTATGQWNDDGFDENDCPQPLGTDTEDCPAGYLGQRSREGNVCQNGTYTYGPWSNTCQIDPCYGASACDNGVPSACEDGFYLKDNKCKKCSGGAGVKTCNSYGYPTSCWDGYFESYSSSHMGQTQYDSCASCQQKYGAGTLTCNKDTALTCMEGYSVNYSFHTCNDCSKFGVGTLTCQPYSKGLEYGAKTCATGYHRVYTSSYYACVAD